RGQEDLLSFVPQDFKLFAGANLSMIPQQPKWQLPWQMGIAQGLPRMPPALGRLSQLITDIERVLVAVNPEQPMGAAGHTTPELLVALRTKAVYSPPRLRELLGIEKRPLLQVKDKRFYLVHTDAQVAVAVQMVNDRIVVFALTHERRLGD